MKKGKFVISVILLLLFAGFIAVLKKVDVAPIGAGGTYVGLSQINKAVFDMFGFQVFWYKMTQIVGYGVLALAGIFVIVGIVQMIQRKGLTKTDKNLYALAGLYVILAGVYVLFEKVIINYRPIIMPNETSPEASFPSSHTMLAIVIVGSAMIMLKDYIKSDLFRYILYFIGIVIIAFMVCGRLLSGVHWLTDIIGSVLISSALLVGFSAFVSHDKKQGKYRFAN